MVAMMEILIGDNDWLYRDFFGPWQRDVWMHRAGKPRLVVETLGLAPFNESSCLQRPFCP
jgi:hypothetical protein